MRLFAALLAFACAASLVTPARAEPSPLERSDEDWRTILARIPQLAPYASEFSRLPPTAAKTALERGGRTRETVTTWSFLDGPFEWKPNAKQTFWIVTGSAGSRVVIAVFEPGATPRHLASAVLLEPDPALAIGWSASEPNRLLWTTCYGCRGLGGSIDLASDGNVAFVYR